MEEFSILNIPVNFVKGVLPPVDPPIDDPTSAVASVTGATGATGDTFAFLFAALIILAVTLAAGIFAYKKLSQKNIAVAGHQSVSNAENNQFSKSNIIRKVFANPKKAAIAIVLTTAIIMLAAFVCFQSTQKALANDNPTEEGKLIVSKIQCNVYEENNTYAFDEGTVYNSADEPQAIALPCGLYKYEGIDDDECTWTISIDGTQVFHGKSSEFPEQASTLNDEQPLIIQPHATVSINVDVEGLTFQKAQTWINEDVVSLVSGYTDYPSAKSKSEFADAKYVEKNDDGYVFEIYLKDQYSDVKCMDGINSVEVGGVKLAEEEYTKEFKELYKSIKITIPESVYTKHKVVEIDPVISEMDIQVYFYNAEPDKGTLSSDHYVVKKFTPFTVTHDMSTGQEVVTLKMDSGDITVTLTPTDKDKYYSYFVNSAESGVITEETYFVCAYADAIHVQFRIQSDKTEYASFEDGTTSKNLIIPKPTHININIFGETTLTTRLATSVCNFAVKVKDADHYYNGITTSDPYYYVVGSLVADNTYVEYQIGDVTRTEITGAFNVDGGTQTQTESMSGTSYTENTYWEVNSWKNSDTVTIKGYKDGALASTNVFKGTDGNKCVSVKVDGYALPEEGYSWYYFPKSDGSNIIEFAISFNSLIKVKYGSLEDEKPATKCKVSMSGTGSAAVGDTWTTDDTTGVLTLKSADGSRKTTLTPNAAEGYEFQHWMPGASGTFAENTVFICYFVSTTEENAQPYAVAYSMKEGELVAEETEQPADENANNASDNQSYEANQATENEQYSTEEQESE